MCCPTLEARKYFSCYLSKGNLSQLFHLSVFVYEGLTRQKTTEFKVLYTLAQTIYLVFSSVQVTEVFLFVQWIQQWLIQTEPKLYREAGEFVLLLITISRKYILTTVRKFDSLSSSLHFNSCNIIVNKASWFGLNGWKQTLIRFFCEALDSYEIKSWQTVQKSAEFSLDLSCMFLTTNTWDRHRLLS